jgi:hypothetical protein
VWAGTVQVANLEADRAEAYLRIDAILHASTLACSRRRADLRRQRRGNPLCCRRPDPTASPEPVRLQARGRKRRSPLGRRDRCFAAAAAMSHAGERSLLGAECGHEIRAARVTPLARSGQRAGMTQIGVKQPRRCCSRWP